MRAQLQKYGERGCLIRAYNEDGATIIGEALRMHPPQGFSEFVQGYDNMLLIFSNPEAVAGLNTWVRALPENLTGKVRAGRRLEVPVSYHGADLAEVARLTDLSEAEVVAIHTAPEYRVRMMGFSPGFPYLDGLDSRLHLDRRGSPRNHIAPGSVAIGGSHAGIYTVASPGGWHILGQTERVLFRPDLAKGPEIDPREVFALAPGDRVKFIAID
jgi:KipI family sensor histidine kinase inhibitor